METCHYSRRLSEEDALEVRKWIVEYWNGIAQCDYLGGVLGELLREKEIRVTELLEAGNADDVYRASLLTAEVEALRRSLS